MALRFYNTLTQQVQEFVPADGNTVRMYTCGPTVYNFVHIGNLRTFTFQDLLRRWLRASGFALNHVMNITDVEDKIIRTAMAAGQTIYEYTKPFETAFLEIQSCTLHRNSHLLMCTYPFFPCIKDVCIECSNHRALPNIALVKVIILQRTHMSARLFQHQ